MSNLEELQKLLGTSEPGGYQFAGSTEISKALEEVRSNRTEAADERARQEREYGAYIGQSIPEGVDNRAAKALWEGTKNWVRQITEGMSVWAEDISRRNKQIDATLEWANTEEAKKYREKGIFIPEDKVFELEKHKSAFTDMLDNMGTFYHEAADARWMQPDKTFRPESWFEDVLMVGPQVAGQMITTAVNPALGVAGMAAMIAGATYESLMEANPDMDESRARSAGVANAIMQAPLEYLGVSKALKFWKARGAIINMIKKATTTLGTEFLTEWLQSYPEAASRIWAEDATEEELGSISKFWSTLVDTTKQGIYEGSVALPWAALGMSGGNIASRVQQNIAKKRESARVSEYEDLLSIANGTYDDPNAMLDIVDKLWNPDTPAARTGRSLSDRVEKLYSKQIDSAKTELAGEVDGYTAETMSFKLLEALQGKKAAKEAITKNVMNLYSGKKSNDGLDPRTKAVLSLFGDTEADTHELTEAVMNLLKRGQISLVEAQHYLMGIETMYQNRLNEGYVSMIDRAAAGKEAYLTFDRNPEQYQEGDHTKQVREMWTQAESRLLRNDPFTVNLDSTRQQMIEVLRTGTPIWLDQDGRMHSWSQALISDNNFWELWKKEQQKLLEPPKITVTGPDNNFVLQDASSIAERITLLEQMLEKDAEYKGQGKGYSYTGTRETNQFLPEAHRKRIKAEIAYLRSLVKKKAKGHATNSPTDETIEDPVPPTEETEEEGYDIQDTTEEETTEEEAPPTEEEPTPPPSTPPTPPPTPPTTPPTTPETPTKPPVIPPEVAQDQTIQSTSDIKDENLTQKIKDDLAETKITDKLKQNQLNIPAVIGYDRKSGAVRIVPGPKIKRFTLSALNPKHKDGIAYAKSLEVAKKKAKEMDLIKIGNRYPTGFKIGLQFASSLKAAKDIGIHEKAKAKKKEIARGKQLAEQIDGSPGRIVKKGKGWVIEVDLQEYVKKGTVPGEGDITLAETRPGRFIDLKKGVVKKANVVRKPTGEVHVISGTKGPFKDYGAAVVVANQAGVDLGETVNLSEKQLKFLNKVIDKKLLTKINGKIHAKFPHIRGKATTGTGGATVGGFYDRLTSFINFALVEEASKLDEALIENTTEAKRKLISNVKYTVRNYLYEQGNGVMAMSRDDVQAFIQAGISPIVELEKQFGDDENAGSIENIVIDQRTNDYEGKIGAPIHLGNSSKQAAPTKTPGQKQLVAGKETVVYTYPKYVPKSEATAKADAKILNKIGELEEQQKKYTSKKAIDKIQNEIDELASQLSNPPNIASKRSYEEQARQLKVLGNILPETTPTYAMSPEALEAWNRKLLAHEKKFGGGKRVGTTATVLGQEDFKYEKGKPEKRIKKTLAKKTPAVETKGGQKAPKKTEGGYDIQEPTEDLRAKKAGELSKIAKEEGISLKGVKTKGAMVQKIKNARKKETPKLDRADKFHRLRNWYKDRIEEIDLSPRKLAAMVKSLTGIAPSTIKIQDNNSTSNPKGPDFSTFPFTDWRGEETHYSSRISVYGEGTTASERMRDAKIDIYQQILGDWLADQHLESDISRFAALTQFGQRAGEGIESLEPELLNARGEYIPEATEKKETSKLGPLKKEFADLKKAWNDAKPGQGKFVKLDEALSRVWGATKRAGFEAEAQVMRDWIVKNVNPTIDKIAERQAALRMDKDSKGFIKKFEGANYFKFPDGTYIYGLHAGEIFEQMNELQKAEANKGLHEEGFITAGIPVKRTPKASLKVTNETFTKKLSTPGDGPVYKKQKAIQELIRQHIPKSRVKALWDLVMNDPDTVVMVPPNGRELVAWATAQAAKTGKFLTNAELQALRSLESGFLNDGWQAVATDYRDLTKGFGLRNIIVLPAAQLTTVYNEQGKEGVQSVADHEIVHGGILVAFKNAPESLKVEFAKDLNKLIKSIPDQDIMEWYDNFMSKMKEKHGTGDFLRWGYDLGLKRQLDSFIGQARPSVAAQLFGWGSSRNLFQGEEALTYALTSFNPEIASFLDDYPAPKSFKLRNTKGQPTILQAVINKLYQFLQKLGIGTSVDLSVLDAMLHSADYFTGKALKMQQDALSEAMAEADKATLISTKASIKPNWDNFNKNVNDFYSKLNDVNNQTDVALETTDQGKLHSMWDNLKQVKQKWDRFVSVEAPWQNVGAHGTGLAFKNMMSNRTRHQIEAIKEARNIIRLLKANFNTNNLTQDQMFDTVLLAERPDSYSEFVRNKGKEYADAIKEPSEMMTKFFKDRLKELEYRGITADFVRSRLEGAKLELDAELKKKNTNQKKLNKLHDKITRLEKTNFVHIPLNILYDQANQMQKKRNMSGKEVRTLDEFKEYIVARHRETESISKLVDDLTKQVESDKIAEKHKEKARDFLNIVNQLNPANVLISYGHTYAKSVSLSDVLDSIVDDELAVKLKEGQEAPEGWVTLDNPGTDGLLYGYAMRADAYDAMTAAQEIDTMNDWWGRKMAIMKMMAFYNPVFLPFYDTVQSAWSGATGPLSLKNMPAMLAKAGIDVGTQNQDYLDAMSAGLFSKPFDILFDELTDTMDMVVKNSKTGKFKSPEEVALNLFSKFTKESKLSNLYTKGLYRTSWDLAWKMDEVMRMYTFNMLREKGMNIQEAAQTAAQFHGDYASVPAKTRRMLNRFLFTPTFKMVMAKTYKNLIKNSFQIPIDVIKGKKLTPQQKQMAAGTLGLVAVNVAFDIIMRSMGFAPDDDKWYNYGRKYSKEISTPKGRQEIVLVFSAPTNLIQRYAERAIKGYGQDENPAMIPWNLIKYEFHPLITAAMSFSEGKRRDGSPIYNRFDKRHVKALKTLSWGVTSILQIGSPLEKAFIGKGDDLAKKYLREHHNFWVKTFFGEGWVGSIFGPAYSYVRNPDIQRDIGKMKNMESQFRIDQSKYIQDHGTYNPDWLEEYDRLIQKQVKRYE